MLHKDSDEARRQMAAGTGSGDSKFKFTSRKFDSLSFRIGQFLLCTTFVVVLKMKLSDC